MNSCGTSSPSPISEQLTRLRKTQAIGQLLVAAGGFIAFVSLMEQIPLLAQQAAIVQGLQARTARLERKAGIGDPGGMVY